MAILMNNKSYGFRHQHSAALLRFPNNDKQFYHIILCSSNIWSFIYSLVFFIIYGYITNSHSDQLPAGLTAQLVEQFTGISQVMDSNPFHAWIFFRFNSRHNCLSCVYNCKGQSWPHIILHSSNTHFGIYSFTTNQLLTWAFLAERKAAKSLEISSMALLFFSISFLNSSCDCIKFFFMLFICSILRRKA